MENRYGSGFFNRLSADLQREIPNTKGFSPTNIKYVKYFYELYSPLYEIRQQLVDELFSIPWGHHVQIISKCKGNAQSTTHSETPKRYSKTWEAILKYHGTTVVNDLTLLL
jgi:hypothetical protein